jgi:hypothetical protein
MTCFKVLFQHLPGGAEETHRNPQPKYLVSQLGYVAMYVCMYVCIQTGHFLNTSLSLLLQ